MLLSRVERCMLLRTQPRGELECVALISRLLQVVIVADILYRSPQATTPRPPPLVGGEHTERWSGGGLSGFRCLGESRKAGHKKRIACLP